MLLKEPYSLIVASAYEPWSILEKLYPYLAGSAPIVFHSPYHQVRRHLDPLLPLVLNAFSRWSDSCVALESLRL